jgi:hypothetical protein
VISCWACELSRLSNKLSHFAFSIESNLKNNITNKFKPSLQTLTLDDINHQWAISRTVHPAFGRQLCHFAVAIEKIVVRENSN